MGWQQAGCVKACSRSAFTYALAGSGGFLDDAASAFLAEGIAPGDPMAGLHGFAEAAGGAAAAGGADAAEASSADETESAEDDDYKPHRNRAAAARRRPASAGKKAAAAAKGGKGKVASKGDLASTSQASWAGCSYDACVGRARASHVPSTHSG